MQPDKHLDKLRDFSSQLTERLKAAPAAPSTSLRLAVRIGAKSYLVDMGSAGEIVPLGDVAPVPWTKPWYRGLTNVRGRLVGVIDLPHFSGAAPLNAEQGQQLLVIGEALKSSAALIITRAFGLRNLKELEPLDTVTDGSRPWEVGRYRDSDGTVLTELDLTRLVSFERFNAIGI
ncbi:MAG: chemotaxis protein CheW [Gemmatimonadota bacterium]